MLSFVAIAILLGYFCGSIPFGFLVGKWRGIDIRDHGSGNIGATNVFRILGKRYGIPVFALDVLKGVVPVILAGSYFQSTGLGATEVEWLKIVTAISTILGHNFTCWLRFKGGKGIATSAGALAAVIPWAVVAAVSVWIILVITTRYVSIGSLGAAVTLPVEVLAEWTIRGHLNVGGLVFASTACVLAVWRHKSNIQNLIAGTEHRFGKKKSAKKDSRGPSDRAKPSTIQAEDQSDS